MCVFVFVIVGFCFIVIIGLYGDISLRAPAQSGGGGALHGAYGGWGMWFPPGPAFETMQAYTVSFPHYWDSPLLSVIAPKQRCHLPILSQIWKHVYLCETATGLSLWRKTLSCPVCLCAVQKWSIMKNDKEKFFGNTSWGWRRVWDHKHWDVVFSSACMEETQCLRWWSQEFLNMVGIPAPPPHWRSLLTHFMCCTVDNWLDESTD